MSVKDLLKNKIRFYSVVALMLGIILLTPKTTEAATAQINTNLKTLAVGDTVILTIVLNSGGIAINNAEATIKFPADLMEIISVSKSGSIFSLWVEDPIFSNTAGTISFNGGVPTPGFIGNYGTAISISAKAKKAGQAEFFFAFASVRANDGLGTDVLTGSYGNAITIIDKDKKEEVKPAPEPIKTEPATPASSALKISSTTHPRQDQWYKNQSPVFQWVLPLGVESVQTGIGSHTATAPQVTYSPPISQKAVGSLGDGVWYFKVRAGLAGVWGPVSSYTVRIDTRAPKKGNVEYIYDEVARVLRVTADIKDEMSGINYYELYINDDLVKKILADEFVGGNYDLPLEAAQDNIVKLKAFDMAGNSMEDLGAFNAGMALSPATVAPEKISIIELNFVPSIMASQEQLLIQGKAPAGITEVTVYVQYNGELWPSLNVAANSDGTFFALTPKLAAGDYAIWAEAGAGGNQAASKRVSVKAIDPVWSMTVTIYHLIILFIIIAVLALSGIGYYFIYHYQHHQHRQKIKMALSKEEQTKTLILLKKRLEKHLTVLQKIRRSRILTREEKEIKEALEGDLDEIDRELDNLKAKR